MRLVANFALSSDKHPTADRDSHKEAIGAIHDWIDNKGSLVEADGDIQIRYRDGRIADYRESSIETSAGRLIE